MASILKVDELQGITAAGDITVTSEGGAATQSLQQGLAKSWVNFTQISTQTIRSSVNVSSLTDGGTGLTTISFVSAMADSDFVGSFYTNANASTAHTAFSNQFAGGFGSKSTSSVSTNSYTTTYVDAAVNDVVILGDLA